MRSRRTASGYSPLRDDLQSKRMELAAELLKDAEPSGDPQKDAFDKIKAEQLANR